MLSLFEPYAVRQAEKQIAAANNYAEWAEAAQMHDRISGKEDWKKKEKSSQYDYRMIRSRLDRLRECRASGDDRALLFTLNEGIHGNLGGMGNSALYSVARFGTKQLITEYIDEIADALEYLSGLDDTDIAFEEKLDFFHRARHCFGRTALMLSGGAALGNFHLGVIKALVEEDVLPRVVSGASAGAVFAAMVGTHERDGLKEFFKVENLLTASKKEVSVFKRLWHSGYQKIDLDGVVGIINSYVADMTFAEAYELTRQHINITVSPAERQQKSRLLNAVTSPNILVRSAVLASAAIPGIFPPVTLMAKGKNGNVKPYLPSRKWVDGSFSDDLPAKRLARLYGVNHYIVSLTNPFALPLATDPSRNGEFLHLTARAMRAGMREYATVMGNLNRRFMKPFPRAESILSLFYSVLSQSYTGDINIICEWSLKDPRRLLTLLTPEEMMAMIRHGERATWPKIEAIRYCTKIGRILDDVLETYENRELDLALAELEMEQETKPRKRPRAV